MKLFILFVFFSLSFAFKPVVMFHGYGGSHHDFDDLIARIQKAHPGTQTHSLNLFNNADSIFTPVDIQVQGVISAIKNLSLSEYHLMCHSQGALACRVALQQMENSTVDKYISLSGPHMGQYGLTPDWKKYFPGLITELAYLVFYTEEVQDHFAPAGYWNDPYEEVEYLEDVYFLPVMNNQSFNPSSHEFKRNFIHGAKNFYFFGSPQDEIIAPWYSAVFGFYDNQENPVMMESQPIYIQDWIGLKTLNEEGKLYLNIVPGVKHIDWLTKGPIFEKYLEPLLD